MSPQGPETGGAAPQSIDLTFTYTETEAVRAGLAVTRAVVPQIRAFLWLGGFLVLVGFSSAFMVRPDWHVGFVPVALGAILCGIPFLTRWSLRRNFRRLPVANANLRWSINGEVLHHWGPKGHATFAWSALHKVKETRHGFLLFANSRVAHWLPRTALAAVGGVEAFRNLVEANRGQMGGRGNGATGFQVQPDEAIPAAPSSDGALAARFCYTADEAERARRALELCAAPWVRYRLWIVSAVMLAVVTVALLPAWDWTVFCVVLVVLSLVWWRAQVKARRLHAQAFASSPGANREFQWTMFEDRIEIRGSHGGSSFRWDALIRIRETERGFLFYSQPKLAQWLPVGAFAGPDEVERFRALVRRQACDFKQVRPGGGRSR